MTEKYKILKVRDKSDNFYTEIPDMFDLPFKLLITSKSQVGAGKTTILLNLLANPKFPYHDKFKGEDIYLISNNELDNKLDMLASRLKIPDENRFEYSEEILEILYENLEEQFKDSVDENEKPTNKLLVFDDVGYTGDLKSKQFGIISKIICNGRHANISSIFNVQRFQQASTTLRANITGAIIGSVSQKDLEAVSDDFNMLDSRKAFVKMFRDNTKNKRDFMVFNFTSPEGLYFDKNFKPIDLNKYIK